MIEFTVSSAANVLHVPTNYPIPLLTKGQYKLQFHVTGPWDNPVVERVASVNSAAPTRKR